MRSWAARGWSAAWYRALAVFVACLYAASVPAARPDVATAAVSHQARDQRAPYYGHTLAVGDSVMLDVQAALQARGIEVDAAVSRQFFQGIDILQGMRSNGRLPWAVVVGLGTNGPITDQLFDQMMHALQGVRLVVFVTVKEPRYWEGEVNGVLGAGVARWPQTQLADWYALSSGHPEWFWADGIHLRPDGSVPYATLVAAALSRGWTTPPAVESEAKVRER